MKVVVIGLGYVGSVTAASLASQGHQVVGVDTDQHKVDSILAGTAPFYEPGLEDLIAAGRKQGLLTAGTSMAGELADADVALICVGTPSERNGNLGLGFLRKVSEEIGEELRRAGRKGADPLIVAVRSTVFPGTCEDVVMPALGECPAVVVSNPEFLREGAAVDDFLKPSLLVVGGNDPAACQKVADLYAGLPVEACLVSLRTAEMIKYACNCFHAVKISFANEIGALATSLGVNGHEVMTTLCRDYKLNTSAAYLKPGFAFGGSCLPKDLRALVYRASRLDLHLPVLENTLPSNQRHLQRAVQRILQLPSKKLGIFGLAFKEDTDDLRESPVVEMIEQLIGKGKDLRIFDPHIRLDSIYGSNREFLLKSIPHVSRWLANSLEEMLDGCDHILIAQKPSKQMAEALQKTGLPMVDLVGAFPG